jgi:quinol monooxygenase YgiN
MRQSLKIMLALAPCWLAATPLAQAQGTGDSAVYVVRYIEVAPGSQKQAAGLIKKLADASRKEAGATSFNVLQRKGPANQFATFEIWKDQASLDAHVAAAHKQFLDAIQPILIAPVDDRPCAAIDTAAASATGRGEIYAITHVDVAPPNTEAGMNLLKAVAGPLRMEDGNVGFDALQQTARKNHFEVVEIWKDQKAEDAHEIEAATKDYRAKVQPLLGAHYDRRWYKSL